MHLRLHGRRISVGNGQWREIQMAVICFLAWHIFHSGRDIFAIKIERDLLLIKHQSPLPHCNLLDRKIEQILCRGFLRRCARLGRGLIGAAVRIDHQMKHKTINGNIFQRNLTREKRNNLYVNADAVSMSIRNLACRLAPVDRYIAGLKMQRGKVPGKRFQLHPAARHLLQFGDHSLPDSLPERIAVQVNQGANRNDGQRQPSKDDDAPELALLRPGGGRRDVDIGFAAHGEVPALVAAAGNIRSMWAWARRVFNQLLKSSSMRCSASICSILSDTSSSFGSAALRLRTSGKKRSW